MPFPFKVIDLTHTLELSIPTWDGGCGFNLKQNLDYSDCITTTKFRCHQIIMNAGVGTHIDAPVHCIAGAKAISELDLSSLCAPCFVVDISVNVEKNSLYKLSLEDIMTFESKYGKIQSGGFVIVLTGWDKFWGISGSFRNEMKFPTLSPEAVKYLIEERIISGIGIDTLSVDLPGDRYLCHELLLGSGKYIVECVANAKALPPTGSYTMALPIKVKDATEAPVRLVALLAVLK